MSISTTIIQRRIIFIAMIALSGLLTMFLSCSDDPTQPDTKTSVFEAHEWGVMVGCKADTSFFLTSRPEAVMQVDIPVIYFHSEEKSPFTAKVTFSNGKPTATYPEADTAGASATWIDVNFAEGDIDISLLKPDYYVPLQQIIDILNRVDADLLEHDSVSSRFLFYEGEAKFANQVSATYDLDAETASLTNNADYTVYDLLLVAAVQPELFSPTIYFSEVSELKAGETVTVDFTSREEFPDLVEDMVSLGFTESEAESFSELWKDSFFYRINISGWVNLIYRLPQEEYDKLISLEIDPQPTKVIRALYILTHMEDYSHECRD